jgi:DNA-binding protein Fis
MRPGSGGHYTSKFRTTAPNGPVRWVSEWGRVLFDRSGQPERMVGVLLDITERKRLADAAEASANDLPEYLRTGAGHEAADARELSGEGCTLAAQERALLLRALEAAQGNRSKAARTLQMGRNAFRYKLRKYALEAPEPGSAFAAAG